MLTNALKRLRKKAGLTQKQAAQGCAMSQSDYSRAEAGRYALDAGELDRAAETFRCAPADIYPPEVRQCLYGCGGPWPVKPARAYKTLRVPLVLAERAAEAAARDGYASAGDYMLSALREKLGAGQGDGQ